MLANNQDKNSATYVSTALLLLILAIASFLRFRDLSRTSLWYDEAVSWSQSSGSLAELVSSVAADNYPPLHNVVLWLSMSVLGDSETALRLPSAFFGVMAIWLTYLVGTDIYNRSVGLLAASLLTFSPFHIWYSTEARMYALMATTGLFFLLGVLKLLQKPTWPWAAVVSVGGALFLYSHIYALLGFAGVGMVCSVYAARDLFRKFKPSASRPVLACLAMAGAGILFLPWLIILTGRAKAVADAGFWIAYPDLPFLTSMTFSITGSLALFWILALLASVPVIRQLMLQTESANRHQTVPQKVLVCTGFTLAPALLAYLYSVSVQPVLFDRYLIAAWPVFLLLAACGAISLVGRLGAFILLPLAVYLSLSDLQFTLFEKVRPEWRIIASQYQKQTEPGDRLFLYKGFAQPALAYYLRQPNAFTPIEDISEFDGHDTKPDAHSDWLMIVHSNSDEMKAALQGFGTAIGDQPAARAFGWGASGLTLIKRVNLSSKHGN